MLAEHLGNLADEFITFYNSSARFLAIREFLTSLSPQHIVVYTEFFYTKGIIIHAYSDHFDIHFVHGEYTIEKIKLRNRLKYEELWYLIIILTLQFLNKERVPF